jgi:hypothetical protein
MAFFFKSNQHDLIVVFPAAVMAVYVAARIIIGEKPGEVYVEYTTFNLTPPNDQIHVAQYNDQNSHLLIDHLTQRLDAAYSHIVFNKKNSVIDVQYAWQ